MANLNLSQFTTKTLVEDADWVFVWDTAGAISKKVSRNSLLNSGTLTTSAPVTISQTWADVEQTFKALVVNAAGASDANSATASLLLDLQVNGTSKAWVTKQGGYRASNGQFVSGNGIGFAGGLNTGFYSVGGEQIFVAANNNVPIEFKSTSVVVNSTTTFGFGPVGVGADTILLRDSASGNTLALRNSTAAQTFNVYGTYTSITDYKRLSLSCSNTTGNATIGVPFNSVLAVTGGSATATVATVTFAAQAAAFPVGSSVTVAGVTPAGYNATAVVTASTTTSVSYANTVNAAYVSGGTATVSGSANWILQSGGHLLAGTDNTYDIGATTANRPRNVYVAGTVQIGTSVVVDSIFGNRGGSVFYGGLDGNMRLTNNAGTDFNRIQFGGITNLFPALKRSTTTLQSRLADDSAFAPIQGKLTTDTAYTATVVAATGYITIYDSNGTAYRVPCAV